MKLACRSIAASLVAACGWLGAAEAAERVICPPTTVPPETSPSPDGWRAWRSGEAKEFKLKGLAFSDGPPEERVFLNPIATTTKRTRRVDAYDFTSPTYREIWLICQYKGTDIALVRQTDLRGKRCRVLYDGRGAQASITPDFVCE
jgi:hypothetical protein